MVKRARPGRLYLVTAPTYPMLADATFRSMCDVAKQLGVVAPGDIKTSPPPSIKLRTGAEILFRSTEKPEHLRGPNLSGLWMDEASLSKQEAFDILIGRLREGGEQGWLTATFTPKGKIHWTYKTFGTQQPDTELIHATSSENPFLPAGFVHKIRRKYGIQQSRQELGGLFVEGGGNHYFPTLWPRYVDTGDAYRIRMGDRWHHITKNSCYRLLTLDWAMGKPKNDAKSIAARATGMEELKGDHTSFVVADMASEEGLLFILYCLNERIPIAHNAPRLAEVCRRWNPLVVAGDDDNLTEAMLLECRRHRDIPEIKCLAIGGRNKLIRSQAAIVRGERGMVYLPQDDHKPGMEWMEEFCDQLASFTGADGEPDDIADAFSLMGRLADEFRPGADENYESMLGDPDAIKVEGYNGPANRRDPWQ